jgi:transcriptional regulator with XRE-family HTH domain
MKLIGQTPGGPHREPGQAIRELRLGKGLTLLQVSEKTGLSISTLSKLEKGKASLSYDKLVLLSKGLGVDFSRLLEPHQPQLPLNVAVPSTGRRLIQRAGEGQMIETSSYRQLYLATEMLNKKITPMVVEVQARTLDEFTAEFGGLIRHPGEEFAMVLDGELEFHTELWAPARLKEGDSVYFDSDMGHAYLKASEGRCRLVCSCWPRGDDVMTEMFVSASERHVSPAPERDSSAGAPARRAPASTRGAAKPKSR